MIPVKQRSKTNGNNGFSLVELIIAIAIIAVMTAIIVPSYLKYIEKSKISVLETNVSEFTKMIQLYAIEFDQSDWYGNYASNWHEGWRPGDGSMNNYIEFELEVVNSGTYENNVSIKNPYSGKMSILDYNSTLASGDGYRPAIFITSNAGYSYTGTSNTDNIVGTVVAYFDYDGTMTDHIEVFFINKDGTKSDFLKTIG